ncbi:MAG: hypothetical protein ABIG45_09205, partial [Bacillota bacterium]
ASGFAATVSHSVFRKTLIKSPARCQPYFPHLAPDHSVLLSSGSLPVAVLRKTSHPRFAFDYAEAAASGTLSSDAFP